MNDPNLISELQALEAWFCALPHPRPRAEVVHQVKSAVGASLATDGLAAPEELKHRIKLAVRRELAAQREHAPIGLQRADRRSAFPVWVRPWLAAAAALMLVVGGQQLLRVGDAEEPAYVVELDLPFDSELDRIEARLAYLELTHDARELVLYYGDDLGRAVEDEIERSLLPGFYPDLDGLDH